MDFLPQRSQEAMQRQFETSRKGRTKPGNLREQVNPQMWPTPRTTMSHGAGIHGQGGQDLQTVAGGQLNADWVEILQGLPIGYTDISQEIGEFPGWPAPLGANLWPTPSTADRGSEGNGELYTTSNGTIRRRNQDGTTSNLGLSITVKTVNEHGQYDYEPPRVITGQKDRTKRLKALGNCNPPQQYLPIFKAIVEINTTCQG